MITPLIKILLGLFLTLLGLGYICRPDIIERINKLLRETILNDSYIALERKKWGFFFILIGIVLFYMGMSRLK
jgi:hypothetical protein